MSVLLHDFIRASAARTPDAVALGFKDQTLSYAELWQGVEACARGLAGLGVRAGERVAVYLPKLPETVIGLFGTAAAGAVFVPVNPILKPDQVGYILRDCNVRVLITSVDRAQLLAEALADCPDLRHVVVLEDDASRLPGTMAHQTLSWAQLHQVAPGVPQRRIDNDLVSILYTSGSTGRPKGVVLSHRNMVAGALSVAEYLENTPADRLLAVLPFSFDYGLSQCTTAFHVGASVVLMDYLLPRDVIRAVARYRITGLAAVPPLWNQLAILEWPVEAVESLRYITNSGFADLGQVPGTETRQIEVSYQREASTLSIDSVGQPAPPVAGPAEPAGGSLDVTAWLPAGLGILGVALVVVGAALFLRSRRRGAAASVRQRHRPKRSSMLQPGPALDASVIFCHSCGAQAAVTDKFCRQCGTKLRG